MGIFSGLFKSRDKPQNRTSGSNYAFFFGGTTSSKAVTERSAMQMTAVYSCVRILSEAVAGLPLHLYKYTDSGGKAMALDHPLYCLLHDEPNPEMSSFVFRETLMTHLLLWGNAYAQIIRNGKGEVVALYPLMPNRMEVNRDKNGKLDEKKAIIKLIDTYTISQYTAQKLFGYHLEQGKDVSAEVKALEEKVEAARKAQPFNENFELLKDGKVETAVRKLTKEEIDLSVRRVSRIVKISMFMDRYPAELSGGQQQRVAIARTLAPEPSVLFMDEPLSNLDAKLRLEMRYELQRLHVETGSTFVYVTHDQMEAMTLATQICLMNNGVLQQYAAPLEVYNHPANLFAADFVGNPSINFVEAKGWQGPEGSIELTLLDGHKAVFTPEQPLQLPQWFHRRDEELEAQAQALKARAGESGYVEKSNKDETFRYHIARVNDEDDGIHEEPILTNEDLVLGIRPEFLSITGGGNVECEIYGAMPTGMESTVKVRIGEYLLTGVVFGSTLFTIGSKHLLDITGSSVMLFDRSSGRRITSGTLKLL